METKVHLTYCGKRFSASNKIIHKFINEETGEQMCFDKKLHQFTTMGDIVEAVETEKGVKSPFSIVGKVKDQSKLDYWWSEQASALQTYENYKNSKKPAVGGIDELIKRIRDNTSDMASRRRVVNYVISKLL